MTEKTEDFPAPEKTPGQAESRTAYRAFVEDGGEFGWWRDFWEIRERFPHFKNWRIWVYVAWASSPVMGREPATEADLASKVLGCTDRSIRNWKAQAWTDEAGEALPDIEEAVAWAQASPLLQHRRDIFNALVRSALLTGSQGHQDRKLALQMMGDFDSAEKQIHSGKVDMVGMSIEEWRKEQERRRQEVGKTLAIFEDDETAAE